MIDRFLNRRWLRFSVRTLLVAVTIFCVWLGWQVSIVRERKAALQIVADHGGASMSFLDLKRPPPPSFYYPRLSVFRRWLGDKPIMWIKLQSIDDEELCWLGEVLPETNIWVYGDNEIDVDPYGTWNRDLKRLDWPGQR